jgi:predicted Zn-dependent peptidase
LQTVYTVRDAGLRGIFELIHLMVERPTWNQKAFERACTAIVSGSRAVQKSLERANHDRVLELIYGPDRRFREPTAEEVAQLTLEDVQQMVEKFLRPDNLEVRIVLPLYLAYNSVIDLFCHALHQFNAICRPQL